MAGMFKVIVAERHRLSTDGVGVTTLVALIGCPLACKYCINAKVLHRGIYKEKSAEQLFNEVMQDYCYFVTSGGGVTFGGGESLLAAEEILEFIALAKPYKVAVNLETSLNAPLKEETFDRIVAESTQLIVDIKSTDPELYKAYTGRDNELTRAHLKRICELGAMGKCRIRVPVIPEFKDEETAQREAEEIRAMGFEDVEVFSYKVVETGN